MSSSFKDQIQVTISGYTKRVLFSDLKLTQRMMEHHDFSFTWMYSGSTIISPEEQAEAIRKYTANEVIFTFKSRNGEIKVMSKGVINELISIYEKGSPRGLYVKGISHTVLLSEQPKSRVFLEKNIKEVALKIFEDETAGEFYQSEAIQPRYKKLFPAITQYNETSFDFLKRLAAFHGEWFYFDGMRMQFGNLKSSKVKLKNYVTLYDFTIKSKLKSHKTSLAGYDPTNALSIKSAKAVTATGSADGFSAMTRRDQLVVALPNTSIPSYTNQVKNITEIEELAQRQVAARDANSTIYTGMAYVPIGVGQIFTVQNKEVYHELVAVKVTHYGEYNGEYRCKFKAIPADVEVPHYTNIEVSAKADTQPAIVIDNNDPEGLGRVKVKFYWANYDANSDWMRVMQQYSGKNWGQYNRPEIGDEVLVSFENGNVNHPYILGSHYNGKAKPEFFDSTNSTKGWKFRFGQVFKFIEKVGIWLSDPSGNEVHLNEETKSISLTSSETIRIKAKNIIFDASENIVTMAGQSIVETAVINKSSQVGVENKIEVGGNLLMKVKGELFESIDGDVHSEVKKDRNVIGGSDITLQSKKNNELHSKNDIQNNSNEGTTQN
ncbi:type VI secretion system Vgr family protein [Flavobacterium hercynium]|uniref:Type IV secretion protein Rhs n=1 Tax=Flavobacterium hercynium TaxID=387094 RepID=A0A226HJN6_9FLAO|nr:phage baseplate assembly protein V [Flavobacterium hercynium]OXA93851.1 type IV secretion protein Rhs [Flavobacterium hercynium]SMP20098.1 Phage late control gene D protein (GPD) [Flavobacterium hercynium]